MGWLFCWKRKSRKAAKDRYTFEDNTSNSLTLASNRGYNSYPNGKNSYPEGTKSWSAWREGYNMAREEGCW